MAHLPRIGARMAELLAEEVAGGISSLVCGDFNVVRCEADIKNWKPNHNKRAGVLDEEIVFLNQWVEEGWRDTVRDLAGDAAGPVLVVVVARAGLRQQRGLAHRLSVCDARAGGNVRAPSRSAAPTNTRSVSPITRR